MSEADENIVQYRIREMADTGMLPDFLVWLCEAYPEEVACALIVAGAKVKEG